MVIPSFKLSGNNAVMLYCYIFRLKMLFSFYAPAIIGVVKVATHLKKYFFAQNKALVSFPFRL